MIIRHRLFATALGLAVLLPPPILRSAEPPASVSLAVQGRSNATPWVAASGSFVAVTWGATYEGKTDVFAAVSRDGARTFGRPVRVNSIVGEARLGGEFPPRVAIQPRPGSKTPEIAVLWTAKGEATEIKVARSTDGGRTFTRAVALQGPKAAGDRGWPALALDKRGRAHAIWLDHRGMAASRTGTSGRGTHQPGAVHDGAAMAQKSALRYASLAGTATPERELTTGVCYCCKTALAVGPDGAVYAAWRHVYPGNLRDMAFSVSRDGGRTFSPPVRISQDGWELNGCPDDGPALAVDSTGTVHVIWPTVIPGARPEGALFYSTTRDGRTFTPRLRVPTWGSLRPTHPQIAVDRSSRVLIAWDEMVNGRRVATIREVRRGPTGPAGFAQPIALSNDGSGTYPVLAAAAHGFVAVWTSGEGEGSVIGVRSLDPSQPIASTR